MGSISPNRKWLSGPDWAQRFWSPGRSEPIAFGTFSEPEGIRFLVCRVSHSCLIPDGWEEEACRTAAPRRAYYSVVFYFSRTRIPAAWNMLLVGLSQSTLPQLPHSLGLRSESYNSVCVRGEPCCGEEPRNRQKEQRRGIGCRQKQQDQQKRQVRQRKEQ